MEESLMFLSEKIKINSLNYFCSFPLQDKTGLNMKYLLSIH